MATKMIGGVLLLLCASGGPSHAFVVAGTCGSKVIGGIHSPETFEVDTCDTPMSGTEFDVLEHGRLAWNTIQGMTDMISYVAGDSDCNISTSDNDWEIALVPANDPVLDGNSGMTVKVVNPCFWPFTGNVKRADVVIDQTLPQGALTELSASLGARETTIHELGHVLGAKHENSEQSVMCELNTCGKVGRRGLTSVGNRAETQFPDDTDFGLTFNSSSGSGKRDAATSPWHFDSNNGAELIYGNSGLVKDVCPGEITTLSYGVGNLGKRSFSLASRLEVEIVFSSNTTISTGDTPMGAFNLLTVAVGEFRRVNTLLFVPNSLTPGQTYHVGVIADPEGDFNEDDELNNSSQTGLRLFVRTSGC